VTANAAGARDPAYRLRSFVRRRDLWQQNIPACAAWMHGAARQIEAMLPATVTRRH